MLCRCCGAGGSVMIPVLTEVPLGGEDQLWPNTALLSAVLLGGHICSQEEGKGIEKSQ